MSTINELIYNLKNASSGGVQASDDWKKMSNRQIEFQINYTREILIRRDLGKGRSVNPDIEQDLGTVDLIQVDKAESCIINTDCLILRTANPIPQTIELEDRNLITYVGTLEKTFYIPPVPTVRQQWIQFEKYTKDLPRYYHLNGYIYITNNEVLEYINIRGVFLNPREVQAYNQCTNGLCYDPDNDRYPIAGWMIEPLTKMLLAGPLQVAKELPIDILNNTQPGSNPPLAK